jgi:hypothetical protein
MSTVEVHPDLRAAVLSWFRGEAPLAMDEIAPLPVQLSDGRTVAFGELTPDELRAVADSLRVRAERDLAAIESEVRDR